MIIMGFLDKLKDNISSYGKKVSSSTSTVFDVFRAGPTNENLGKQAIYPQWFFSARLGQPRNLNTTEIRTFSKSCWVQMVLNTIKKEVSNITHEIVKVDDDDETDYTEEITKINDFFDNINPNKQTIDDINSEVITDIGEIDAGVWNLIYTVDSYTMDLLPIYDSFGRQTGTLPYPMLKPFGQREVAAVKSTDGASFLKQVDIHKNILMYYQYSFKNPQANPTPFEREEIIYFMMNKRSYSTYGFSPVQSIQQVLELLIQGTRWNKDFFKNNAIPDFLVSVPKVPPNDLKKLKRIWNNNFKAKPHPVGFVNYEIGHFMKLSQNNRDMEWLDGQKWYYHLVFGAFGVSPSEAGFFESSNQATDENQARVTVRNAIKPHLKMLEQAINSRLIPEILQQEKPGIMFKFFPKDHVEEKVEFDQNMQMLNNGVITINEYRKQQGKETVEWGDEPLRRPIDKDFMFNTFPGSGSKNETDPEDDPKDPKAEKEEETKRLNFTKSFEVYMENKVV